MEMDKLLMCSATVYKVHAWIFSNISFLVSKACCDLFLALVNVRRTNNNKWLRHCTSTQVPKQSGTTKEKSILVFMWRYLESLANECISIVE
jgi:hypothetical protein